MFQSVAPTPSQALVVGAGPTGMTLACELKLAGVDYLRQARWLLVNLWAGHIDYLAARPASDADWHLPGSGAVRPVSAVLIRPDGYVTLVNTKAASTDIHSGNTILTQWIWNRDPDPSIPMQ